MASVWNPQQYDRFKAERQQPFFDLMALLTRRPGRRIIDLGCGTGELTRVLHGELEAAETLGIDSSETMLARAEPYATETLRFEHADLASFPLRGWEVIFSNAALQWLPDHPALLARLHAALVPGGELAVQVPANHDHVSHTTANDVATEAPFREALDGYQKQSPVLTPETCSVMLHDVGFAAQHVRLQVYGHGLEHGSDVVEWVRGTLLTDFERRLSPSLFASFLARYRERLAASIPADTPYFYPFKRLLFWARK